jgi:hypothetical protein
MKWSCDDSWANQIFYLCAMPSIGQTWVLASIGAVVEIGVLSTLKQLHMESILSLLNTFSQMYKMGHFIDNIFFK